MKMIHSIISIATNEVSKDLLSALLCLILELLNWFAVCNSLPLVPGSLGNQISILPEDGTQIH